MEDPVDALGRLPDKRAIGRIADPELDAVGQVFLLSSGQIVDYAHGMTGGEQPLAKMRADKPGVAANQVP